MTEQDILRHAKGWLDKLADGVDPLTEEPVPVDDAVRKDRIAKCLRYVSGVLEKLISQEEANTYPARKQPRLPAFAISEETLAQVPVSEKPVTITEFTKTINALIDQQQVDKLKTASLLEYLDRHGFLEMRPLPNGRSTRQPTQIGQQLGIGLEERQGADGPYTATVYSSKAQRFLLKHMDEIVEINTAKYNEIVDTGALQGAPWTREQDAQLRELYQQGASLAEIARSMQRSTSGIQARLNRLGLAQTQKQNT